MKKLFSTVGLLCALTTSTWALTPTSKAESKMEPSTSPSTNMVDVKATYDDIKATLGLVPGFLKSFPESGIAGAWADMKGLQLGSTAIPHKYKELIGVAVSAQVPCKYCTYFHTSAAKVNKASQAEIGEAVAIAACVRRWSTFINGIQTDEGQFKSEVDKMLQFVNKKAGMQAMEEDVKPSMVVSAEDAYKEIEQMLGFVPSFLSQYPKAGIVGVWNEMKGVEMNPSSAIPMKYKHLAGLAVSSQVPCSFCIYYHTKAALQAGASKEELNEAIAIAGITRQWSTVLNGNAIDERTFMSETDQIMNNFRAKMKRDVTLR